MHARLTTLAALAGVEKVAGHAAGVWSTSAEPYSLDRSIYQYSWMWAANTGCSNPEEVVLNIASENNCYEKCVKGTDGTCVSVAGRRK